MKPDPVAEKFILDNIEYYRKTSLTLDSYHKAVEAWMRTLADIRRAKTKVLGVSMDKARFKHTVDSEYSEMYLQKEEEGKSLGLGLQTWDDAESPYCAYAWIWVKDKELHREIDARLKRIKSDELTYEFDDETSYISAYFDGSQRSDALMLLERAFDELLNGVLGLPRFRRRA